MSNETIATETTEAVGELPIDELLSDGITNTPPSFVRAILAAASDPAVTSFAGGLPNPVSFPVEAMEKATAKVLAENGQRTVLLDADIGLNNLDVLMNVENRITFDITDVVETVSYTHLTLPTT